jgi:LysR family glycine cleavage system transcriptional activator
MARALPPLNWVRAFEAAARHQSFRLAADELGVSAGAVSQKVKALELHLGVALFARRPRGVLLTAVGRRYRDDLIPALDAIAAATGRIAKQPGGNRLRIVALPAIAEKWLTPRLPLFRDIKPELNIEVSVAPDVSELAEASFDVAVHYGIGDRADLVTVPLFRDEMFPVCSPALAEEIGFAAPADLIGAGFSTTPNGRRIGRFGSEPPACRPIPLSARPDSCFIAWRSRRPSKAWALPSVTKR